MRTVSTPTHWPLLVRMDEFSERAVDCTRSSRRMCNHGDLQHLLGCIQLLGRHIPPIRFISVGGSVILQEHAGRCLSAHHNANVQRHDLSGRWQFPRRRWTALDVCSFRSADPRSEDQSKE